MFGLTVLFGLFHGLAFLPVLLSIIGPENQDTKDGNIGPKNEDHPQQPMMNVINNYPIHVNQAFDSNDLDKH